MAGCTYPGLMECQFKLGTSDVYFVRAYPPLTYTISSEEITGDMADRLSPAEEADIERALAGRGRTFNGAVEFLGWLGE